MADEINDTVETPPEGTEEQSAVEDGQEQVVETEETPAEETEEMSPEDKAFHKYQSWQGRREKDFEEKLFTRIADVLNKQPQYQAPVPTPQLATVEFTEQEPDEYATRTEWADWRDRKKVFEATVQQDSDRQVYAATLQQSRDPNVDEATHQAAMNEMAHDQHYSPTGMPLGAAADAVINYNTAVRQVYEKRLNPNSGAEPINPLANQQIPKPGLAGIAPGAGPAASSAAMPKLDSASRKLLAHIGREGKAWNAVKVGTTIEGSNE